MEGLKIKRIYRIWGCGPSAVAVVFEDSSDRERVHNFYGNVVQTNGDFARPYRMAPPSVNPVDGFCPILYFSRNVCGNNNFIEMLNENTNFSTSPIEGKDEIINAWNFN